MERHHRRSPRDQEIAALHARYPIEGSYSYSHRKSNNLLGIKLRKIAAEIVSLKQPSSSESHSPLGFLALGFVITTARLHSGDPSEAFTPPAIRTTHSPASPDYSLVQADFPQLSQDLPADEAAQVQEIPTATQSVTEATSSSNLSSVFSVMEQYPTRFPKERFEDLEMYWQIYIEAAKKYGIDPKILWIFHQEETNCSRDPLTDSKRTVRDYDEKGNVILENTVKWAMQMDEKYYGPKYVDEALVGLEYLKNIKTRSPHDAESITAAARKISEDLKTKKGDYSAAFRMYAAGPVADRRLREYWWYLQILPPFIWQ